ncbi:MAG: 50S ribosomal protein L32 [Myxococcales bacterium]|nr:MAG: 50S ribosomal protein L32 [Myxococcales bacterium]
MAVPKKHLSKARRDQRRAHHAIDAKTIVNCPNCGESMLLHRVCPSCGYYKGKEVVKQKEEKE